MANISHKKREYTKDSLGKNIVVGDINVSGLCNNIWQDETKLYVNWNLLR